MIQTPRASQKSNPNFQASPRQQMCTNTPTNSLASSSCTPRHKYAQHHQQSPLHLLYSSTQICTTPSTKSPASSVPLDKMCTKQSTNSFATPAPLDKCAQTHEQNLLIPNAPLGEMCTQTSTNSLPLPPLILLEALPKTCNALCKNTLHRNTPLSCIPVSSRQKCAQTHQQTLLRHLQPSTKRAKKQQQNSLPPINPLESFQQYYKKLANFFT